MVATSGNCKGVIDSGRMMDEACQVAFMAPMTLNVCCTQLSLEEVCTHSALQHSCGWLQLQETC